MADSAAPTSGMKKELTLFNFFTIGFGAIIGTGWVLLVGDWSAEIGRASVGKECRSRWSPYH